MVKLPFQIRVANALLGKFFIKVNVSERGVVRNGRRPVKVEMDCPILNEHLQPCYAVLRQEGRRQDWGTGLW